MAEAPAEEELKMSAPDWQKVKDVFALALKLML